MFRVLWAKRVVLSAIAIAAGCLALFIWPIHFGLTQSNPDAVLMSMGIQGGSLSTLSLNPSFMSERLAIPINPSPIIRPVSGTLSIIPATPEILRLLPLESVSTTPIVLTPRVVETLRNVPNNQPRKYSFDLIPLKQTQQCFIDRDQKDLLNSLMFSNTSFFPFWTDSTHQFVNVPRAYLQGFTFHIEQHEENHKPVLQVSAIRFGTNSFGFLAAEMPGDIATTHPLSRCEGLPTSLKFPADREGFYALRIPSQNFLVFSLSPIPTSNNASEIASPLTLPSMTVYTTVVTPSQPGNENLLLLEVHPK